MRIVTRLGAAAVATALSLTALAPAQAVVADSKPGTKPLVKVLGADGTELDSDWKDFDIVEAAVLTVIEANPDTPLTAVANGKKRLTVFVPTDQAFRNLVQALSGDRPGSEEATVEALLALPDAAETIESILLYHVVAGSTLTSDKVVAAIEGAGKKGAKVEMADGNVVRVKAKGNKILIVDKAPGKDARLVTKAIDLNKGNRQVAHGITEVLLPSGM